MPNKDNVREFDMKKRMAVISVCCIFLLLCTSCTSLGVRLHGEQYFVGKTENDLIKYFGDHGIELSNKTEYDKVVRFCNQIDTIYMDKTIVKTYKEGIPQLIFSLNFVEYNDGCLCLNGRGHYSGGTSSGGTVIMPRHSNDNHVIKSEVSRFWSEVKRLNAVPTNNQDARFNSTPVGNWYFVYKTSSEYTYHVGNPYVKEPSSSIPFYHYDIWRIDVSSKQKETTYTEIAYIFDLKYLTYYDLEGEQISLQQALANEKYYENQGYIRRLSTEGMTVDAYIKDEKIIKIEKQ